MRILPYSLCLALVALCSCQKEGLPVQTNFPFTLTSDPVPQQVYLQDGSIKIRLYIDKSASFNPTTYFFSYYILVGRGQLTDTTRQKQYEVNTDYSFSSDRLASREA